MNKFYSEKTIGDVTIIVEYDEGDEDCPPYWGVWTRNKADDYISNAGILCGRMNRAYRTNTRDDAELAAGMLAQAMSFELDA